MLVKTQANGRDGIGLRVGTSNARRYFSKHLSAVVLHLGDLEIQCTLSPEFWNGQPEINDPRLNEWLKYKVSHARSGRKPMNLAMVQTGVNSFTLHSIGLAAKREPEHLASI